MKLIVIDSELNQSKSYDFDRHWLWVALATLGALLVTLMVLSWMVYDRGQRIVETRDELNGLQQHLLNEQYEINNFYTYANSVFTEQAKHAGMMEARVARLEALGGRLADTAQLSEEFDFYSEPAIGGPDTDMMDEEGLSPAMVVQAQQNASPINTEFAEAYQRLEKKLKFRQQELVSLENLLIDQQIQKEQYLAGKPVASGWLSSKFGKRIDPFHGRVAWHHGVDFAGDWGSPVLAVASGVVIWSGDRYGYGDMVEIDHGNGYATRYAHNSENLVKLGDVVTKGQQIAKMGSSGRSTGPHVHFEVVKNGKKVNPRRYIYR